MRLHRAPAATALLLAATLALAACSEDEPRAPEPTPSPSGTTPAPTPSPSAKPTEPVLPEAAKEPTEAGARAFITYYWDLINYAQVTGDVKTLRRTSAANCAGCTAGIDGIRDVYKDGGRVEGGDYSVSIAELSELDGPANAFVFEALVTARNTAQTIVRRDGTEHRSNPSSAQLAVAASWTSATWRMEVMDPQ